MKNLEEKIPKNNGKLDILGIGILIGTTLLFSYLFVKEGHFDQMRNDLRNYDWKMDLEKARNVPYNGIFL